MNYIGFLLITIGFYFIISGIIGLYRFPDFYTKIHAAGVVEICGVPICLIGLACLHSDFASIFKLLAISFLMLLLNPVATHAIARAALGYKIDKDGRTK